MSQGRILLADDEPTFAEATADLLRREGFEVETVSDGPSAIARVRAAPFDLLISDLEMPGNSDLELVKQVAEESGGLPIIILTGYPSVRSAVACIELPVSAYLVKPVSFEDLYSRVTSAVKRFRTYQAMRATEDRLEQWRTEVGQRAAARDLADPRSPGVDVFLSLTLRNVMGTLTDLEQLSHALVGRDVGQHACQLINCPRGMQLSEAIKETVRVLEETKGAFKSKTLGELRRRLELLLEHN
jgi:DNA-binding response OmpR family regulator